MAEIDVGMPKADLKKLLNNSPADNAYRVAVGLHKTPGFAYIRVAKSGEAGNMATAMKKEFGLSAASHGSVLAGERDLGPELNEKQKADKKLAVFRLAKNIPGLAPRLKKSLKGTGFKKVLIIYGDGTPPDADLTEDEEEGEGAESHDAAASEPETAAAPPPPPEAPPPPPPQAPTFDAGALKKRLGFLIPKIATADAAHKAELSQLAANANAQINAPNLAAASVFINELAAKLDQLQAPGATAGGGAATGAVAFGKSRLIWIATRKKMEADLTKLHDEINATYKDNPVASEIDKKYTTTIAPLLATLDEELADKLDDVVNATDAAKRTALIDEAKALIKRYRDFVTTEPLFTDLDNNPFVPLTIRDTVSKTLDAIAASVH